LFPWSSTLPAGHTLSGIAMNKGVVAALHSIDLGLHPNHSGLSGSGSSKREVRNMEKLLLSPAEAAAHLSIGRSKVYELMRLGELRSVKIGASRRIPQAALADFIAALAQEPR
jgi:excisionase family DNA binding protein